jgi:hypothetical protein
MGADCKSVAKATQVRILDPPLTGKSASDQRKRRSEADLLCPAVSSSSQRFTGVHGEYAEKFREGL